MLYVCVVAFIYCMEFSFQMIIHFFSRDQTVYTTSVMNKNIADVFSNTNIVRKHCLANIFVERKHQKM